MPAASPPCTPPACYRYDESQRLFVQRMPHIALSTPRRLRSGSRLRGGHVRDRHWAEDAQRRAFAGADAVRGAKDGEWLKTILEEAEERGLSTGIVTNMAVTDATPAACYAHVSARSKRATSWTQFLKPRFGDGVDVSIGAPPAGTTRRGTSLLDEFKTGLRRGRLHRVDSVDDPASASAKDVDGRGLHARRPASPSSRPSTVAMAILKKNPRGYFLMVEWDMHTNRLQRGLDRVVEMDTAIEKTAAAVGRDTLVIFTADHSYDLRMRGGKKGEPDRRRRRCPPPTPRRPPRTARAKPMAIRVDDGHTGEQVLVGGAGAGSRGRPRASSSTRTCTGDAPRVRVGSDAGEGRAKKK